MDGKPGCLELMAHRAHGPVSVFGLQQVLNQPTRCLYAHIIWFALVCCQFIPRLHHAVQTQLFEFGADITAHD